MIKLSTFFLLLFTLTAFATNSILCRLALKSDSIGAIEFTAIRIASGILILLPLLVFYKKFFKYYNNNQSISIHYFKLSVSSFWQALTLFSYAVFFSLAYVKLDTAVGAIILFPTVQITMMGISVFQGNKVTKNEWLGFSISLIGLIYLLSPGLTAPPLQGTLFMIASGISWGVYSLLGKQETQPILATARNFLFCLPGVILLGFYITINSVQGNMLISTRGIMLAIISGAVASGIGYILWYLSLRRITTTAASISQLIVPIFAALGGILFLEESLHIRLILASILILGGIIITILSKKNINDLSNKNEQNLKGII